MAEPLIEIDGLKTHFLTDGGCVKAVDGLTISIREGQTLGLVGESGSGKSVTSLSIMRLLPEVSAKIVAGRISFLGRDLVQLPKSEMRSVRGADVSMIFQEPGTSLNPVFRAGAQVIEAIRLHQDVNKAEARERAIELFDEVGIPDPHRRIDSYPHEMSGGQKQRVMIAMALSCNPKLLIADEPTTALDVTIQAQILDLIRKLRDERGMSILFITHDLGVIAEIADDVAVMFRGKLVEFDSIENIFSNPQHPYTKGLLACRPRLETKFRRLPTVADFMDVTMLDDGSVDIKEKTLDTTRLDKLTSQGRGRLLHPKTVLDELNVEVKPPLFDRDTVTVAENTQPVLAVRDLKVHYPIHDGVLRRTVGHVKAVDGISFNVYKGQTLGLVGESGCGKTTAGRAILQLIPATDGTVVFDGIDLTALSRDLDEEDEDWSFMWKFVGKPTRAIGRAATSMYRAWRRNRIMRPIRQRMQIIFQDPFSSLNPRMTVESVLIEAMSVHKIGANRSERHDMAAQLLTEVGLEPDHLSRYPHEFSGGQRQRICIARALAVRPEFIVCDESVSALDVSVQAQVLNLLRELQEQYQLTYIFISHDLSVVKFMSDMMAVMNEGKIVEFGPSDAIYADPQRDYTKRLIESIPNDSLDNIGRRQAERKQALESRVGAA